MIRTLSLHSFRFGKGGGSFGCAGTCAINLLILMFRICFFILLFLILGEDDLILGVGILSFLFIEVNEAHEPVSLSEDDESIQFK